MIASTKAHVLTFWPVKLTIFIILYRCQNAVNNNVKIDLKVDDGKWLNLKKNPTPAESQVPYVPIQGWKKFSSHDLYLYQNILIMGISNITLWNQ